MFWNKKNHDAILLTRLSSEVEYLRDQNQKLLDRLLAIFDSKNYVEIKQIEAREEAQKIQKSKVEKITAEDFQKDLKKLEEDNEKMKLLNMQFSMMQTGNEVM
ncbi:MAG: hypothetical protein SFW66_08820 [Gammaproteobacteria bacterium]|nr:hypothetical protein [Gammaproteobacteria bacterium]